MKICIFSDIHGNYPAFCRMLEAEGDASYFLFAGDIFGYFYGQEKIMGQMIRMRNLFAVKGNHDYQFLCCAQQKQELADQYGSSYYTTLPGPQAAYLDSLPEYLEFELAGKRFGMFHGGMEDPLNQRIYPDSSINADLAADKYDYLVVGHTHYRFLRKENGMTIINPGSLGQPRDGLGFGYCVLNPCDDTCEFKNVYVNIEDLLSEVKRKDPHRKVCNYLCEKYGGNP